MLGNFLKIDYNVVCFIKPVNSGVFFMGNDRLSGKQVGSQASRRAIRRLAWIQPVCISINAVPALKGLMYRRRNHNYAVRLDPGQSWQLALDPTCLPLSLSFPIKNKQNFMTSKADI